MIRKESSTIVLNLHDTLTLVYFYERIHDDRARPLAIVLETTFL